MTGPDLDDDHALDDALRALGTPAAGRPAATATALLASAPPAAAPVGMGLSAGIVGAAVVAALGAGTVLGFGAAAALFVGSGGDENTPVVAVIEGGGRDAHRYGDAVAGEKSEARDDAAVAVGVPPTAEETDRGSFAKADPDAAVAVGVPPIAEKTDRDASVAVGVPPTALRNDRGPAGSRSPRSAQAVGSDIGHLPVATGFQPVDGESIENAVSTGVEPAHGGWDAHRYDEEPAIAEAPEVAPKATTAAPERLPKPQVVESSTPVRHEAQATWALGLRVTSGGPAWKGTIDGLAPELAGAIGFVAGGGALRPRLRADLAVGVTDSRPTAATSGLVGLSADLGPARLDFGGALGFRWIAAAPGAETPFDDEAGWLVFGLGPSATLVVPRRGADVFFGAEALYSSLSFDGEVHRVPWLGVTAGIEIHGSKARRLYR